VPPRLGRRVARVRRTLRAGPGARLLPIADDDRMDAILRPELVEGFVLAHQRDDHFGFELCGCRYRVFLTSLLVHSNVCFVSLTTAPIFKEH